MFSGISSQSRGRRFRVAVVLVGAVAVVALVSGAYAAKGPGPTVKTFSVVLDGAPVPTATGYQLDGVRVSVDQEEYTLRISLQLNADAAPAQAFMDGHVYPSAVVNLLDAGLNVLKTYTLTEAKVVSYRQSGDAKTNSLDQQLVLTSDSLFITP